jgi:hypothetical protein
MQEEGIHVLALGSEVGVFLDPAQLYVFDRDGALVAAPERAGSRETA